MSDPGRRGTGVAVVTGAAGGIGRATARKLAREGMAVAMIDIDRPALEELTQLIHQDGGRALAVAADCSDGEALRKAFSTLREELGPVSVLVNNVGIATKTGPFHKSDLGDIDLMLSVNLKAAMICCREVIENMRVERRGRIVNVASDSALYGDVGAWSYIAAKSGALGFTRSLAREMAPFNVTVNAVAPGHVRTAMTSALSEESRQRLLAATPMGQAIEPEDIAEAIAFLASERSRFITGQTLAVNGGRWML